MTTKPTIVFVPGAWHSPSCFQPTVSLLEAAGYNCVGVSLPSVGASPPLEDFLPDVNAIRAAINSVVDHDKDVLLFMHSYGGQVGCAAVKGLDKHSRLQAGKQGGVSHLFFCCAFALPEGISLMNKTDDKPLPWYQISDNGRILTPATPEILFYHDIEPEAREALIRDLRPHSYKTIASKQTYAAWRDVPSTYLICEQDKALPAQVQRDMIESCKGNKTAWRIETIEASHTPFVSMPEKTAMAVRRAAGETI